MFDPYSRTLFEMFPDFEGLVREDLRRALSSAYLMIIEYRINGEVENTDEVQSQLRKIANTLLFHAVLKPDLADSERKSAAFVSAEALALIAQCINCERNKSEINTEISTRAPERFVRLESALLYLYSEYDVCASGVLSEALSATFEPTTIVEVAASWSLLRLERLCKLKYYPALSSEFSYETYPAESLNPGELEDDTIARLYVELGTISTEYFEWLVGERDDIELVYTKLRSLIAAMSLTKDDGKVSLAGYEYSRVYHLATLLQLCLPELGNRSLLHTVPRPTGTDEDYKLYLAKRAKGSRFSQGRPVLWPSAHAYVSECLIGESLHAVASMPTGSGKSFVAELAISQAVHEGWALYLAPTNALTEQIRKDLRIGLRQLKTDVAAFIGDHEYSVFSNDHVEHMSSNSVAVMTPEKCSLALRLSPEVFSNCALVVFDECHLIGDRGSSRGPLAELVMAQLMARAPNCRFLLMSAIVQNPEDLAGWLEGATGSHSSSITTRWRPTRTLRAVFGLSHESINRQSRVAHKTLKGKSERYKKQKFSAQSAFAVNLQGAWQSEDANDYTVNTVNYEAPLNLIRFKRDGKTKYGWDGVSWVNLSAIGLGKLFVEAGIQTLIFTPSSKHYPFQNGSKLKLSNETLDGLAELPDLVGVCKVLAEYELGCESEVFSLIEVGVSVHTSLMIETEKVAAELAFNKKCAPVMFATGTLAQGLNLPAIAVIIAGSRIGDPRGQNQIEVQRRKFSQLLNAAGRAGRAGFANQGIVVAIPDKPVAFKDLESYKVARDQVDYLQHSDNAVPVESGLNVFLDTVCRDALNSNSASESELLAASLLAGGDEGQIDPVDVLKKTYASYYRKKNGLPEVTAENAQNLIRMGSTFIEETGAPEWITIASQRAGLDFFLTLAISQAWAKVRAQLPRDINQWSVEDWANEFIDVVANIPPALLSSYFQPDKIKHVSKEFSEIVINHAELFEIRRPDWQATRNWGDAWRSALAPLKAWMTGKSYSDIASLMAGDASAEIESARGSGKPIPKALALSHDIWSSLSLIAGGLLAIAEQILDELPLNLASLPMCIKYGCDTPETLAWFRYGVRLRRPSRALAKKFPSSAPFNSDEELREWVYSCKEKWMESEEEEDELYESIRAYIER